MAAKKKAKKRATKRKLATRVSAAPAKKPGRPPRKSALIDAILAENKNLGAKDVLQKAKEKNVKISVQSVYNNATWKALQASGTRMLAIAAADLSWVNLDNYSSCCRLFWFCRFGQ